MPPTNLAVGEASAHSVPIASAASPTSPSGAPVSPASMAHPTSASEAAKPIPTIIPRTIRPNFMITSLDVPEGQARCPAAPHEAHPDTDYCMQEPHPDCTETFRVGATLVLSVR